MRAEKKVRGSGGAGRSSPAQRIPLNTLAISFGMSGLAVVWSTVSTDLGWPPILPAILWAMAAITWVWLIVAHLHRGLHSDQTLASQLRHPAQGPIAAIVPTVGMLLGSELFLVSKAAGAALTVLSMLGAAAFAGWILAHWHRGRLNPEAFHGAFLLPTVAAAFIASIASTRLGLPGVAFACFAIGVFFWVAIVTVLLARLAFFPPLPDALTPTLAILLAPPAVGGAAWFTMNGVDDDPVSLGLLGMLVLMLIVQVFMLGTYRRLAFTLGFWSFTFPVASSASYGIQWLQLAGFEGRDVAAVGLAVVPTALTAAIAIRSLILVTSVRLGVRRAEQSLRRADDAVSTSPTPLRSP
jgi:tellurite resistance protein